MATYKKASRVKARLGENASRGKTPRPFNNRKRTKGRQDQIKAEKYYKYLKAKFKTMLKEYNEKLIEEQIKKLDEGISNK